MPKATKKILMVSLGCDKNLVDSEMMLGMLSERGFAFTDSEEEADIAVVNTCCFINDAKEESINTLLEMAELRKTGGLQALVAAGCLAQRYSEEIQKEIPEVDAIIGTTAIDKVVETIEHILEGNRENHIEDCNKKPVYGKKRVITTGGHYAYLKIAEGCDKNCTYCIIPKVRGNYRSIPTEELVKEAETLAESGVKELILVAQETTLYGVDLYGKKSLPLLLSKLAGIEGIRWIRLLYCYPEEIDDELIQMIKSEEKICHYLDMPIQHGSDAVLKRMGRRTDRKEIEGLIEKLRREIPDICIRTTMITGFPQETEAEFEEMKALACTARFDRLGVFTYSREEGTAADKMKGHIRKGIKVKRRNEIMELQQEIAFEKADKMKDRTVEVLIEGFLTEENTYIGRTYRDAPGVDGYIFVESDRELMTGDFVSVKVTGSYEYDLMGEIVK